jgi:hypothetical protein
MELEQQGFLSQYQSIRDSFLIYSDALGFSAQGGLSLTQSEISRRSLPVEGS